MPFASGEFITAARLNALQPVPYEVACSSNTNAATAVADVTGATITFSTVFANAVVVCQWSAHFDANAGSTATAICFLNIDTVDVTSPAAAYEVDANNNRQATTYQSYKTTLASAGSHTIKLRVQKTAGTDNAIRLFNASTRLLVTVYEVV